MSTDSLHPQATTRRLSAVMALPGPFNFTLIPLGRRLAAEKLSDTHILQHTSIKDPVFADIRFQHRYERQQVNHIHVGVCRLPEYDG